MSQDHRDDQAPGADDPKTNDRREFIRQSLGAAPLMLTLGGRSHGGKTSMHGTLWSSLGTKWKHKGRWWDWKGRRWHWSKESGDKYRGRDDYVRRTRKDDEWRVDDKTVPARKDWDWEKSGDRWRLERELEAKRSELEARRGDTDPVWTDRGYDWRKDDDWKRSEGLSPFVSDRSDRKKD